MQQNIPQIMQQLLKLANEVDVDALSNVMEDFVEVFATELTPFAVALSEQLRDTYMRIVRELLEKNENRDDGSDYGDYLDDKSITALGVLQTIGTLILTLESTPDVLLHMEAILMPVIKVTLENKLYGKSTMTNVRNLLTLQIFTTRYSRSLTAVLSPLRQFPPSCGKLSNLSMPLSRLALSCILKICYPHSTTLYSMAANISLRPLRT